MKLGIDSPKNLSGIAKKLVESGRTFVCRYYFSYSKFKDQLTRTEALALSKAGLFIISVWENGFPTSADYFTAQRGRDDAKAAVQRAIEAGQPKGTPIYFAVDADIAAHAADAYFIAVNHTMQALGSPYKVGAYASGAVLAHLTVKGLIAFRWLAQSRGWSGFEKGKETADIIQGKEGELFGIDVDLDWTEGHGGGWQVK
jgi:hypothetical protein